MCKLKSYIVENESKCSKVPCLNGGSCQDDHDDLNGYKCNCVGDWLGVNCSTSNIDFFFIKFFTNYKFL